MNTNYATSDGFVSQRSVDYYEARAAGGAGLVIVEFACVESAHGRGSLHQLNIDDDAYLPGLSGLAKAIKRHGVRALIQIHHAGREAHYAGSDVEVVAPSAVRPLNPKLPIPRALSTSEIGDLVGRYAEAADRAKRAGFDGVEIHGAHGFLIGQFLSPLCNHRDDEFGGPLENRARVLLQVVQAVRGRVGAEFALQVRLSGDEFVPGGIRIEETCAVARMLEDAGVDAIHVSAGGMNTPNPIVAAPACYPGGYLLPLAQRVKREVRVPVIGVGRINTPSLAEGALRDQLCDFVAIGRGLIADPEFPKKAAGGTPELIRPCLACLYCAHNEVLNDGPLVCASNPSVGRERELTPRLAEVKKKVFVIGGGLAGMEAARVASLRGHEVTLVERDADLGGQLIPAAIPPHKSEVNLLRQYYLAQMRSAKVRTCLGETSTPESIAACSPDTVILATGSKATLPAIQGIDRANVVLAVDVLLERASTGSRVLIIGGELVGCETAEFLARRGKRVTITKRGPRLAAKVLPVVRRQLLKRLNELGVVVLTGVRYKEITASGVVVSTSDAGPQLVEADTVVVAAGSLAERGLAGQLAPAAVEVIGDAAGPRRFVDAIREGNTIGLKL